MTHKGPPQIILQPDDPTVVIATDTVQLHCVAYADPPQASLNISWSRDGDAVNETELISIHEEQIEQGNITFTQSILQICSIGLDNIGNYSCIAENVAGNDSANFELIVPRKSITCRMCTVHDRGEFKS